MSGDTTSELPPPTEFPERERFDLSAFACPRCQATISAPTYGPCESCVAELRATQQGEGGEVTNVAFEPKMNVTPNAVALKDD